MTATEEEAVEAYLYGAHQAPGDRVRSRRSNGRLDDPDALRAEHLVKACWPELLSLNRMRNVTAREDSVRLTLRVTISNETARGGVGTASYRW